MKDMIIINSNSCSGGDDEDADDAVMVGEDDESVVMMERVADRSLMHLASPRLHRDWTSHSALVRANPMH